MEKSVSLKNLSSEQNDEVCDATEANPSIAQDTTEASNHTNKIIQLSTKLRINLHHDPPVHRNYS